jgi:hypothetical protein
MAMTDAGGPETTPERSPRPSRRPSATLSHVLAAETLAAPATSWVRNWASQDWIAVGYFVILLAALCMVHGPGRNECIVRVAATRSSSSGTSSLW